MKKCQKYFPAIVNHYVFLTFFECKIRIVFIIKFNLNAYYFLKGIHIYSLFMFGNNYRRYGVSNKIGDRSGFAHETVYPNQ